MQITSSAFGHFQFFRLRHGSVIFPHRPSSRTGSSGMSFIWLAHQAKNLLGLGLPIRLLSNHWASSIRASLL